MTLGNKEDLESTNDSSSSLMSCSRDIGGHTAADMVQAYGIEVRYTADTGRCAKIPHCQIPNHVSCCQAYYGRSGIGRQYPWE